MPVGVGDEVDHDPLDPARVGLHHLGVHRADAGVRARTPHHVGDQFAQRNRVEAGPLGARVQAGDLQQVLDQRVQGPQPVPYETGRLVVLGQQPGGGDQTHQRGAQFVRDVGGEASLVLQLALEGGGHVVDGRRHLGDLVAGPPGRADPGVQVAVGDAAGGTGPVAAAAG
ncbi:hypothetical protein GA0115255_108611 [Streptomyces sp. Ncost-T6T-2b]|nr:hypothetical protein GA0115255_108611 [Streptomyces sp. Ncost-T6T-2b]